MPRTEAQKRAATKYNKAHTKLFTIRLTPNDQDISDFLDTLPNKQGHIKALIRADIARNLAEEPKQTKVDE